MKSETSSRLGVVECFTGGDIEYTTTITSTDGTRSVTGETKFSEDEAQESAILAARVAGIK